MNELIWLATLVLCLTGILAFYKLFGKVGMYVWSALAIIVANIQAVKLVNLFGLETALGAIIYSTTFIAIDILLEKYGKKEAYKAIWISLAAMITVTILMALCTLCTPSINDTANDSIKLIFSINVRVALGSIVAYFVSQFCNTFIYHRLKVEQQNKLLSYNLSTMTCQLIDTIIFVSIAFIGIYSLSVMLVLFASRYIFKFVIALIGTPVVAIASKMKTN